MMPFCGYRFTIARLLHLRFHAVPTLAPPSMTSIIALFSMLYFSSGNVATHREGYQIPVEMTGFYHGSTSADVLHDFDVGS